MEQKALDSLELNSDIDQEKENDLRSFLKALYIVSLTSQAIMAIVWFASIKFRGLSVAIIFFLMTDVACNSVLRCVSGDSNEVMFRFLVIILV